jgi:hypothetical protein
MTAEEIRASKNESDTGDWESAQWLREIAAQLAEANARADARWAKADQQIAEAKEERAGKVEFLDLLVAELKPMLPKIVEFIESTFSIVPLTGVVGSPLPCFMSAGDEPLLAYLQSRGHDLAKAQQILANHRDAVIEEMKTAAPGVPVALVPDFTD